MMKVLKEIVRIALGLLLLAAIFPVSCMAAWESPNGELRYEDIAEPRKIVLVFDDSGSARDMAALDHDIKSIFYTVLWEDALTECSMFQFNQAITYFDQEDVWKPDLSRRETNLTDTLEAVNRYLEHGKEEALIILVSDLYDTYETRKLKVSEDEERIFWRRQRAKEILTGWDRSGEYGLTAYTWKSQSEEKAKYQQVNFHSKNCVRLDGQEPDEVVRGCFAKAQQLRTGTEAMKWKEFSEISLEEEEEYWNYYVWTDEAIVLKDGFEGEVQPILEDLMTEGFFYEISGIQPSELGFRKSWNEIYLMPTAQFQIDLGFNQVLDNDQMLHSDRMSKASLEMRWCGENIRQDNISFRLQNVNDQNTEALCELIYDSEEGLYVGNFMEKEGEHQLKLYFDKKDGSEKVLETKEITVYLPDVRLSRDADFADDLRWIERPSDDGELVLNMEKYVSSRVKQDYVCTIEITEVEGGDKILLTGDTEGAKKLILKRKNLTDNYRGIAKYWVSIGIHYMDENNKLNGRSYHEGFMLWLHGE